MNRSAFPSRVVGLVGLVVLLTLIVASPVGASLTFYQNPPEPTARPTVTPAPYLQLNPTQSVAGDPTTVAASGALWLAGGTVTLYWDDTAPALGSAVVNSDGTFQMNFAVPTDGRGTAGMHRVDAVQGSLKTSAGYELLGPTPTTSPTPTNTSPPPPPSDTPAPTTPPDTPTTTITPTPSVTLRPVTPMVTISPIPPTRGPAATRPPSATRTNTPVPGTPTNTLTPSVTPTPSSTPGPGTPAATPLATATATDEMADTGLGWGMIFLLGFSLAGLLVVVRLMRVRGLAG